jgi:hypothetical protein
MQACGCDGVTFYGGCGAFHKPFAHMGSCEDGARPGAGGDGRALWLGAPCGECTLPTQLARLAEPSSEDCGTISPDAGNTSGADCARVAFQAGRPFTVIFEQVGIDSYISTAVVFAGGELYEIHYDSNVCGGGATCDNPRCGPSITSRTCVDPVVSDVSGLFECASVTHQQTVCGPNPDCYPEGTCF